MKSLRGSALITTLLIVILLIVALSTATFAWFSANNVVNVSTISFVAETREGGETQGDLQIGWSQVIEEDNYYVSFANPDSIKPLMPLTAPVIGATKDTDESDINIFSLNFTSGVQENGTYLYDGFVYADDETITPYICKGEENNQNSYYIINRNERFAQKVSVDYTFTGDLSDKLCMAIFIDDTLQFVFSNSTEIYYGSIERGTLVSDTAHVDNLVSISNNNTIVVPANSSVKVTMYAWYNGVTMTDSDVEKTASLSTLKFSGAYLSTSR